MTKNLSLLLAAGLALTAIGAQAQTQNDQGLSEEQSLTVDNQVNQWLNHKPSPTRAPQAYIADTSGTADTHGSGADFAVLTASFRAIVFIVFGAGLYFLPTIVATHRNHKNAGPIVILNILLGWTFLGWVGALVWSATSNVAITPPPLPHALVHAFQNGE